MPKRPFDDSDAASLIAGNVPPGRHDLAPVAETVSELRAVGDGAPPRPSPALMALFNAAPEGQAVTVEAATSPTGRNTMIRRLGTAVTARRLAAKTALGAVIAMVGLTTAAGAGVLPGPARDAVSDVVGAVTPLDLNDGDDSLVGDDVVTTTTIPGDDDVVTTTTIPDDDDVVTTTTIPGDDDGGLDPPVDEVRDNHGACVSAIARAPHVPGQNHGQTVSEAARSDCGKTGEGDDDGGDDGDDVTTTTVPSTGGNEGPGSSSKGNGGGNRGPGGNSGPGNSNSGNGNSGRGN